MVLPLHRPVHEGKNPIPPTSARTWTFFSWQDYRPSPLLPYFIMQAEYCTCLRSLKTWLCRFPLFSLQTILYPFLIEADKTVFFIQALEYFHFLNIEKHKQKIMFSDCFYLYLCLRSAILWHVNENLYVRTQKW